MPDKQDLLAETLGGGHLVILYQPIVEATTSAPRAAEVLARWHDASGELRGAPWIFERIAHDDELLRHLDRQVLTQLVQDRSQFPELLRSTISINRDAATLSPRDVDTIVEVTAQQRDAPLAIELWEQLSDEQLAGMPDLAAALADAGIELWHDDFGTGQRSLAHLSGIQSSVVKLDHHVAAQGADDPHLRRHIRAVIDMLHGLRRLVVAEGIEAEDHAEWLEAVGADWFQGWLYAHPMPAEDISAWLQKQATRAA